MEEKKKGKVKHMIKKKKKKKKNQRGAENFHTHLAHLYKLPKNLNCNEQASTSLHGPVYNKLTFATKAIHA